MARKDFNTIIESLWWVAQGGVKAAICKVSSKSFNVSQLSHSDFYVSLSPDSHVLEY